MKLTRSICRLFVLAIIAAACSSDSASTAALEVTTDDATVTAEVVEDVEVVDVVEDEEPASEDDAQPATTTTIAVASTALEPVSAETVHETTSDDFPDILAAQATPAGDGTWRFDVTVSSTYDSPERYADAWRVVGPDGTEFGIRVLTHDHASEQPFTRSQGGIAIPADVTMVTIEGRDLTNGWGGGVLELALS